MIHDLAQWAELLTQVLIFCVVLYNIKVSRGAATKVDHVATRVEEVHAATNGMSARLEASSKREGVAIGTAIGIQQQKDAAKN